MIVRLFHAVALLLLAIATPASAMPTGDVIRVMSFNVRVPVDSDGANRWEARRDVAAAMIARAAPDVIGTQELHRRQGDDVVARLPRYGWIGLDRRGGRGDEHMGIFYRRDRLDLIDFGHFWLSDTPQVPGSITWGHPYPRMVTWALFATKRGGRRFAVLNTHLPYRAEDDAAREQGASAIAAYVATLPADIPVVLTGDFNTTPDSGVHALLSRSLTDAWGSASATGARAGPAETFHNFTGRADRRIDWIMTRGFAVDAVRTITDHRGRVQTSDHFPVQATLRFAHD